MVVDSVAGTTVDPVDELVEIGGEIWHFVDTAGLRRRVHQSSGTEYYASLRTAAAIDAAEVAIVLLDAGEVISEQDQRVLSMVAESGRALVLAFNKWDLVDEDRRYYLDKEIDRELRRLPWALRVNISAKTGRSVEKIAPALRTALTNWERRVPTGQLNQFITSLVQATPHPIRGRPGAADPVRDSGRRPPAEVRAVHHRPARCRLRAVRRAQAARGVRLHRVRRSRSRCGRARSGSAEEPRPGPGHSGPVATSRGWHPPDAARLCGVGED